MKSQLERWIAAMAAILLCATPSFGATLSALTSFGGGDGYLAPGDRPYLANDNNQRGLAWNPVTNNLLLVNRTGALSVNVLNGVSGNDQGTLNLGTGVITGSSTFAGSMIAAADDGAIYMSNLTTNVSTSAYKIYRWANESAAAPTVAYSGAPLSGARLGDSLDVIGGGTNTRLVAGYGNTPAVSGNNSFALLKTSDGAAYTSETIAIPAGPAGGDFRFGITFTDADTVIGKSGATGSVVDVTGPGVGALSTTFALDGSSINPMDYAVVGGVPYLAAVNTSNGGESKLWVYDMSNPASPLFVASIDNLPGAGNANANGVGQVRFGAITGASAVIYVLNTNNGIQAFKLQGVPEPASLALVAFAAVTLAGTARRARQGRSRAV